MPDAITVLFLLKRVDCNDGVSSYCETLLTGMKANGDKNVIVSGRITSSDKTEPRRRALEDASLEWICVENFRPSRPDLKTIRLVADIVRKYSVDVISPQGLSMLPLSYIVSKFTGKPVIANYHPSIHGSDSVGMTKRKNFKERISYRLITSLFPAQKFIALSKDIVRFFHEDCGISKRRVEYIVAGIDSGRYRPPTSYERGNARKFFDLSDDTLVCVLTGRLSLNKGHDLVIEAVRQLRASHSALKIVCLFPGTGHDEAALKEMAKTSPTDEEAFRFLGFVDNATLLNAYWAADIALLPSRLEGFGLAVAEAMSCGAVPIRTPSGGSEDQIIQGKTGFVIPFNDAAALANRILELADQPTRERMRKATIEHAELYFRKETMVSKTSDLYRRARAG
jgi:glycosyltransferase involved in cell wall biosynthesis